MSAPATQGWHDVLHWCVRTMATDDPDLGFAASLLAYCLKWGGLTERQERYAERLVHRVVRQRAQAVSQKMEGTRH